MPLGRVRVPAVWAALAARCGNPETHSGEPHVHFQLMDHENPLLADGVPFEFAFEREGTVVLAVPDEGEVFAASGATPSTAV